MQIEIKLDESCKEPKIIIHTDKMTEEVSQIVKLLSEEKPEVFAAIHENGEIVLLEQTEIIRIYAENERVYAKTKDGSYRLKARLYELEERLNEYYGAAEPPVRCGESHLSGLTEPLRSL